MKSYFLARTSQHFFIRPSLYEVRESKEIVVITFRGIKKKGKKKRRTSSLDLEKFLSQIGDHCETSIRHWQFHTNENENFNFWKKKEEKNLESNEEIFSKNRKTFIKFVNRDTSSPSITVSSISAHPPNFQSFRIVSRANLLINMKFAYFCFSLFAYTLFFFNKKKKTREQQFHSFFRKIERKEKSVLCSAKNHPNSRKFSSLLPCDRAPPCTSSRLSLSNTVPSIFFLTPCSLSVFFFHF